MIRKELKKLNRRELVDIIYQMKKNEQDLQKKIAALEETLQEKRIRISKAGSIAEAAASITDVFSAAQKSADLYLQEIACRREETERQCAKRIEETNHTVARILSEAEKKCTALSESYQMEMKKYQQLQQEVQRLEKMRNHGANEG